MNTLQFCIHDIKKKIQLLQPNNETEKLIMWQAFNLSDAVVKFSKDDYGILPIIKMQIDLLTLLSNECKNNALKETIIEPLKNIIGGM